MTPSNLIQTYLDQIWNKQNFKEAELFFHPDYKDHSLPETMPSSPEGSLSWITATGKSFEHFTEIEEQVTENNTSIVKIKMHLKHIGNWREIEATGLSLSVTGYRMFKSKEGKIIEHWALIDGQSIENQLKQASHGCKLAK